MQDPSLNAHIFRPEFEPPVFFRPNSQHPLITDVDRSSVSENDQLPEFRQGGILAIKGLQYLCSQFGIDEERMKFLLQYVFRYIHAKMEDGKSLKEIEHLMLGKDVE